MKISEKELKQIIVEALQEEDLEEGIMDKIRGIGGGLKGVGGAAKAAAADAAGKVGAAYGEGSYSNTKQDIVTRVQADLEKLQVAAGKYEKDEEFKKSLDGAVAALRSLEPVRQSEPRLDAVPGDATRAMAAQAAAASKADEPADAPAADAPAADTPADEPAAEEAKPEISVFRGKGGKGVQSQMAKAGIAGKDMSRILKGLKADLTGAGFEVLEELAEANRKEISLDKTLEAIDQITDPAQKEAAKKIIVKLLKKNKVKVTDTRLKQEPASLQESQVSRFAKLAGLTKGE